MNRIQFNNLNEMQPIIGPFFCLVKRQFFGFELGRGLVF